MLNKKLTLREKMAVDELPHLIRYSEMDDYVWPILEDIVINSPIFERTSKQQPTQQLSSKDDDGLNELLFSDISNDTITLNVAYMSNIIMVQEVEQYSQDTLVSVIFDMVTSDNHRHLIKMPLYDENKEYSQAIKNLAADMSKLKKVLYLTGFEQQDKNLFPLQPLSKNNRAHFTIDTFSKLEKQVIKHFGLNYLHSLDRYPQESKPHYIGVIGSLPYFLWSLFSDEGKVLKVSIKDKQITKFSV